VSKEKHKATIEGEHHPRAIMRKIETISAEPSEKKKKKKEIRLGDRKQDHSRG